MIQWWQILLLTLYAGFQIMDELHWYSSAGSAVFSGFITGLIMGDMATGLFIGGSMQLTILGVGTFGGASRIDANSGTLIATAFAVSAGMDPEQALAALGVPVAAILVYTDILGRMANTFWGHACDADIEKMNWNSYNIHYWMGAVSWCLSRMIPVFLALAFGQPLVEAITTALNGDLAWLGTGLTVAGGMLPAVGFAILLRHRLHEHRDRWRRRRYHRWCPQRPAARGRRGCRRRWLQEPVDADRCSHRLRSCLHLLPAAPERARRGCLCWCGGR